MVSYAQPDPWAYYAPNPFAPPYAYSQAPSVASHSTGYYPDPRGSVQGYNMPMMPYGHGIAYPYPSPPMSMASTDDKKMDRLEEFLVQQERARVARDEARERKLEAEKVAAEARAAKEAEERKTAEALANAAKSAKEEAEAKAAAREAESEKKHKEAIEASKKKLDAAKAAEQEAKKEMETHKPSDDSLMGPIKFKDAVGRKFSFPWKICKTWKVRCFDMNHSTSQILTIKFQGMEFLINQAFVPVPNLALRVHDGHYDLVDSQGEIILPSVWETTVKPDWQVTMTMWPLTEPKKIVEAVKPMPLPMLMPISMPLPMDQPRRSKSKTENRHGREFHALPPPPMMGPPLMPEYPMAMNSIPPLDMRIPSERKKSARTPQVAIVNGRKVMVRR